MSRLPIQGIYILSISSGYSGFLNLKRLLFSRSARSFTELSSSNSLPNRSSKANQMFLNLIWTSRI